MAAYDLEEQEQISELKLFWQQNGKLISAGVIGALVVLGGWQAWNWRADSRAREANVLLSTVLDASVTKDAARARAAAGELIDKYPQNAQAVLAALLAAKQALAAKDIATAKAQLTFAADRARDTSLRDIANLRLAAVLLDEKAYDEALRRLSRESGPDYLPRVLDLKGDVLAASGKAVDARAAWKEALVKIDDANKSATDNKQHMALRDMIEAKLQAAEQAK